MRLHSFLTIVAWVLLGTSGLFAQTVRIIFVSGQADLQAPGEPALHAAAKGDIVTIGTRIVTGADGRLALTPMPGVKSLITPNTDLILQTSRQTRAADGTVQHTAVIDLKQGAVVTDLLKQEGSTYDYSIRTPRGLAGARGTTFTVGVNSAGIETIVVAHGVITLNFSDGRQVFVKPGQISITPPGSEGHVVTNLSQLTPAEQKIATNWALITLETLTTATEDGVELAPKALANALKAAEDLGIPIPPALRERIDRLIARNPGLFEAIDPKTKPKNDDDTAKDIVAETVHADSNAPFLDQLTSAERTAFLALPAGIRSLLIQINSLDLTQSLLAQLPGLIADSDGGSKTVYPIVEDLLSTYKTLASQNAATIQKLGLSQNLFGINGADTEGLGSLVQEYSKLPASVLDNGQLLHEGTPSSQKLVVNTDAPPTTNESSNSASFQSYSGSESYFFPYHEKGEFSETDNDYRIINVQFSSPGNLYVGAVQNLKINGQGVDGDTFTVTGDQTNDIVLRAANLIDLNGTGFSSNARSVTISAATINLSNINFSASTEVILNSKLGGVSGRPNFGSSSIGRVNFIQNVSYAGNTLDSAQAFDDYGKNIHIGALAAPAVRTGVIVPLPNPVSNEGAGLTIGNQGL